MAAPRRLNPINGAMRREKLQRIVQMCVAELQTAEKLSAACDCSERSIYRYIATIRKTGVDLRGEPGYGYRIFRPEDEMAHLLEKEARRRRRAPKNYGDAVTELTLKHHPQCMDAGAQDVAMALGSLTTVMAGILAGIQYHQGAGTMRQVFEYYQVNILESVKNIGNRALLEATDKPAGAQGEN